MRYIATVGILGAEVGVAVLDNGQALITQDGVLAMILGADRMKDKDVVAQFDLLPAGNASQG
jgi:hypothetical protein